METNRETLNFDAAMTNTWQGNVSGHLSTGSDPALRNHVRNALSRFAAALERGVFFPGMGRGLQVSETDEGAAWCLSVSQLAGREWTILSNLLAFSTPPGAWPGPLYIEGGQGAFEMLIEPRLYHAPPVRAPFAIDLAAANGYLQDFVLRVEFEATVPAEMREQFCQALDAWVAIVDRQGAFPMAESPTLASVVGPHVCRFEDPTTAIIEGEGMVAAPDAFALIVGLCIDWNRRLKINALSLEVVG